ncbi:MAG: heme o synthase [Verrucomicrobia bacterium]|nr:heme o synthase [Verrucomicrobiota bacterium]
MALSRNAYYEMCKPRIIFMVLVTTVWGYFLARQGSFVGLLMERLFWATMLGTGLGAAGASVLNQYLERDFDRIMTRTRERPLPAGRVTPPQALAFGLWLTLLGLAVMLWQVNLLTAFLVLFTNFLYVLVYTPMKRVSTLNTSFGAIPGAMPPLIGWVAAHGGMSFEGVVLFLILFVWQHPHVYAIGWMLRDDYKLAGFRMMAVGDDGSRTSRWVFIGTIALIVVSVLPTVLGMSSWTYLVIVLATGVALLRSSIQLARNCTIATARRYMFATIIYLPLLLVGLVVDSLR